MHFADGELAWTNFNWGTLRILNYPMAGSETKNNKKHPTQKPIPVMLWSMDKCKSSNTIIDPFMGSGTTLVAAYKTGRKAIGIELSRDYCDIAVQRIQAARADIGKPHTATVAGQRWQQMGLME